MVAQFLRFWFASTRFVLLSLLVLDGLRTYRFFGKVYRLLLRRIPYRNDAQREMHNAFNMSVSQKAILKLKASMLSINRFCKMKPMCAGSTPNRFWTTKQWLPIWKRPTASTTIDWRKTFTSMCWRISIANNNEINNLRVFFFFLIPNLTRPFLCFMNVASSFLAPTVRQLLRCVQDAPDVATVFVEPTTAQCVRACVQRAHWVVADSNLCTLLLPPSTILTTLAWCPTNAVCNFIATTRSSW